MKRWAPDEFFLQTTENLPLCARINWDHLTDAENETSGLECDLYGFATEAAVKILIESWQSTEWYRDDPTQFRKMVEEDLSATIRALTCWRGTLLHTLKHSDTMLADRHYRTSIEQDELTELNPV